MTDEIKKVLTECETSMKKVIEATKKDFAGVRTGRANPGILDRVMVECYGSEMPLNQLAGISAPEARMLLVQPWDKTLISQIEKGILKADLGLNPSNDGSVIRLVIPQLTEERRKDLVKVTRKIAEEKRVGVRGVRREANEALKKLEKDGVLSEDLSKKTLEEVQKITDRFVSEIDRLLESKETEIMEV